MSRRSSGRFLRVSPFRKLVTDLMHFSSKVPSVCMDRRMNLSRILVARQRCSPRPSWSAIFIKAYGIVAARTPELRRVYMPFPVAYLYEHPYSVVTMNIERQWRDENVVFQAQIRSPEKRSLRKLDDLVRYYKDEPVENVKCYRRIMRMASVPWPFRRLSWWVGLNLYPRLRVHNFGTFGITTTAAQGAGIQRIIPILTGTLHYSMFDDAGNLEMRFSFDHRVLDGATAATALKDLETVLHTEILDELNGLRIANAA
jgi:hypothetical protein